MSSKPRAEPMALLKIQSEALKWAYDAGSPPSLGELVAELAWHLAIIRDRLDQAEIPRLEEG